MNTVDMILNPTCGGGRGRQLRDPIQACLSEWHGEVRCHETRRPGDGRRLARELADTGSRLLVVCGGDGTLCEVVNGCMAAPAAGRPPLAVIPIGRGNDFARSLGTHGSWEAACVRTARGRPEPVDVGRCNDAFFINVLGVGLDAEVADFAARARWLRGDSVYVIGLLRALAYRPGYALHVAHDHGSFRQRMTLAAVTNGGCLGGRFRLAPDADISDGLFDLVVSDELTRRQILRLLPRLLRGDVRGIAGYESVRTRRVTISSEAPFPVQTDGEVIDSAARHLEIEVLPGALAFLRE